MYESITEFLKLPAVVATIGGIGAAMRVDYVAFQSFKNANEAAQYDWGTALWRWFQGGVAGFLLGAGISIG